MPQVSHKTIHDLIKFKMFRKDQTESTCVADITYDPETQDMTVAFVKRGTYLYHMITLDEFTDFQLASSQGRYFNFYIRDRYSFERIA
jgi:KTSC domain-containing protein